MTLFNPEAVPNLYQTIPLPDGSILEGFSPSIERYQVVSRLVGGFQNKTFLDIGCCEFSYGIQALKDSASFVIGIENSEEKIKLSNNFIKLWGFNDKALVIKQDVNTFAYNIQHDIVLVSVIIHWLNKPKIFLKQVYSLAKEYFILVWRYPQQRKEVGYRPNIDEVNRLLGKEAKSFLFLSQTEDQHIGIAVYD